MPKMDGPGIAALSIGSLITFAGIKGYSVTEALKNVIQGRNPVEGQFISNLTGDENSVDTGALPSGGGSSKNKAIGRLIAASYGWTGSQWNDLDSLWTRESGWRTTATNPSSGAYGIPQSLPGSKMASAGSDWKTNPVTQIRWGCSYIKERYGSPSQALAHENQVGWY